MIRGGLSSFYHKIITYSKGKTTVTVLHEERAMKEWRRKERVRKQATKSNNTQRRQSLGDMESLGDCLLVYYLLN